MADASQATEADNHVCERSRATEHVSRTLGAAVTIASCQGGLPLCAFGRADAHGQYAMAPETLLQLTSTQHECLSDFPNRQLYGGRLRDGRGTSRLLEEERPGLKRALSGILTSRMGELERAQWENTNTERAVRNAWIRVSGTVEKDHFQSRKVATHPDIFFEKIFPALHDYFWDDMEEEVMIMCAYKNSVSTMPSRAEQNTNLN